VGTACSKKPRCTPKPPSKAGSPTTRWINHDGLARPRGGLLREALRVLSDVLRLVRRLAADKTLPRGVRGRLGLLLGYLAFPIDLIPDFIPVLGYADDAIVVTAVLRSVVRRAGLDAVRAHWPGTEEGFAAVVHLAGLNRQARLTELVPDSAGRFGRRVRACPTAPTPSTPPHRVIWSCPGEHWCHRSGCPR
jgi:uncharacterized membrane protein YkvA (DUF1232 family)